MKLTITVNIPDDFKQLCEIFNLNPEHTIQAFANEVSFPILYSRPNTNYCWPNYFFLNYLGKTTQYDTEKWETHKPFMDKLVESISSDNEKTEKETRAVMVEWHQFILDKRTDDLLDRFKEEDNPQ